MINKRISALKLYILFSVCAFSIIQLSPVVKSQEISGQLQQVEDQREEEARLELEYTKFTDEALFDHGGWFRSNYTVTEDLEKSRTLKTQDFRYWGNLNFGEGIHQFYGRGRIGFQSYNSGDAPDGDTQMFTTPRLDQGFYRGDIDLALNRYLGIDNTFYDLEMVFGRQFIQIGKGLALNSVLDGLTLNGSYKYLDFKLFGSRSLGHDNNMDGSVPGSRNSERFFAGSQFTFNIFENHVPYSFVMVQQDSSGEDPKDDVLDYKYDSNYFGLGITGRIYGNLKYDTEGMYQTGRSHSDSPDGISQSSESIRAFSFTANLKYEFAAKTSPGIRLGYAMGSGDKDRKSVTGTLNGNREGTDDHNFLYFGFVNTGFTFSPRFSNLQFVKLEGHFTPFEDTKRFNDLEIGLAGYHYWRDRTDGAISVSDADKNKTDLGSEVDFFLRHRIFSDFQISIRYGAFFPGKAFSVKERQDSILAGFNLSF